jgi:membrane protease subunit HflK
MYIDTMQQVYSNVTKVFVDTHNNSNLLYLPLDKLMLQAGAPLAAVPAPVVPDSASPPAGTVDVRSRDNQRGPDREGR